MTILDKVPSALREPIVGNADSIISAVVPQYADGATIDEIINFIAGAIRHQTRVSINKDGIPLGADKSNSFKAVVKKVDIFERRGDQNFLMGKKAKIHLEAKNADGKMEDQSIDTEWIEYHGGRKEDEIFGIALANTLVDVANKNIGKEVIIRKGFITGVTTAKGGSSVRFCANIIPFVNHNSSGDSNSSNSGSSSSNSKPLASKDEIDDFIKALKEDKECLSFLNDLSDKQKVEIPGLVLKGLAAGNPAAYINKTLESLDISVNRVDLDKAIAHKDSDFELFLLIAEAAID